MKIRTLTLIAVAAAIMTAQNAQADTILWDFENNDMLDTTSTLAFNPLASGSFPDESFLNNPVTYAGSDSNNSGSGGTYLVRSDYSQTIPFASRTDQRTGIMESDPFFLSTGSNLSYESHGGGGSISVHNASTDAQLAIQALNQENLNMTSKNLDLSAFGGQSVYIRVTDDQTGAWDHVAIDNIQVTNVSIPAPAALPAGLALIGLAAARRRRH